MGSPGTPGTPRYRGGAGWLSPWEPQTDPGQTRCSHTGDPRGHSPRREGAGERGDRCTLTRVPRHARFHRNGDGGARELSPGEGRSGWERRGKAQGDAWHPPARPGRAPRDPRDRAECGGGREPGQHRDSTGTAPALHASPAAGTGGPKPRGSEEGPAPRPPHTAGSRSPVGAGTPGLAVHPSPKTPPATSCGGAGAGRG